MREIGFSEIKRVALDILKMWHIFVIHMIFDMY